MLEMLTGATTTKPPIEMSYIGQFSDTTNATSYSFGAITIPKGLCMVVVQAGQGSTSGRLVSSVTVAGQATTLYNNASVPETVVFAFVDLPSQVTSSIGVTFDGVMYRAMVSIYHFENNINTLPHWDLDGYSSNSGWSTMLTVPEGDILFMAVSHPDPSSISFQNLTLAHNLQLSETSNTFALGYRDTFFSGILGFSSTTTPTGSGIRYGLIRIK